MSDIPVFAFPIHPDVDLRRDQIWGGMTLRDYFAAKAMQGMFASGNISKSLTNEEIADVVYAMADAMMKAREA